jgi:hypothetical protein
MNYKELYKIYSQKYDNMKEYAKKYGETLADDQKLSRDVFKTSFAQKKAQFEAAVGRKLSDKEVVKEILDEQKYSGTLAQTKALRTAMKRQGYEITWSEARKWGGVDPNDVQNEKVQQFWNDVKQQRAAFMSRNPNASSADVAKYIAITMFGSPD